MINNNAGGVIVGQNGFAIRLENKTGTAIDNDTIVNRGTIVGNGAIPVPDAIVLMGQRRGRYQFLRHAQRRPLQRRGLGAILPR